MYSVLKGLRVVEGASFVAAPICCQHLLQLGAEVVRFDMIGGSPDFRRWPLSASGASLYWESLNKGKKSIAIDLASKEGRDLAVRLATAPGENAGIFVTNYPATGFLSHERLAARRPDLITVRIMGWADGRTGLDYTINAASGFPLMTGAADLPANEPVNHVLPAWDLITGAYAAFALMAAERHRRATGQGGEIRVPLSDIAATSLGHLGLIGETVAGQERPRMGNDLFGALGRDFATADGRRVMIVALTATQWTNLVAALDLTADIARLERELGVSFAEEGARFDHRAPLFALIEAKTSQASLAQLGDTLEAGKCCWGPYRTLSEAVADEPGFVRDNPIFAPIRQPSGATYPVPGSAATFPSLSREDASPAPRLGQHTDEVLSEWLGLSGAEIAKLHDQGVVAGPA